MCTPRKARMDAPGAVQHMIIRCIERRNIFRDNHDRNNWLARFESILEDTKTFAEDSIENIIIGIHDKFCPISDKICHHCIKRYMCKFSNLPEFRNIYININFGIRFAEYPLNR